MDDLTLIRRYITKNFDLYIDNTVKIRYIHSGETIKLNNLIGEVSEIFDCDCIDICTDWYNSRLRQETEDLYKYLDKYRVDLGNINWVVLDNDDNEFQIRDMVKEFEGKYDEKFVRTLQNDWYVEKIYKNTEERLKFKLLD